MPWALIRACRPSFAPSHPARSAGLVNRSDVLGMAAASHGGPTLEQGGGGDQEALHVARLELGQAARVEAALAGGYRVAEVSGEAVQRRRRQRFARVEPVRDVHVPGGRRAM